MKTRITLLTMVLAIIGLSAFAQPKYDTLTNKSIVSLTKIGLPPATIISKIRTSITSFDVSVNALIELQKDGVNSDVINEMIKVDQGSNTSSEKQVNSDNPNAMQKPGIYVYNPKDSVKILKRVDPTVTSTDKTGGFGSAIAQNMTAGIAKDKIKSDLAGDKSHLQISNATPTFYFYFENNANPNADSWFFSSATSPNEFALVKLDQKKNSREMVVGDMNAYGKSSGIPNKMKVPFDYTEVSDGIYKVTFSTPLDQGEYCFLYTSSTPSRFTNNKVFDFGIPIQTAKK
jgi:hypothetical protein